MLDLLYAQAAGARRRYYERRPGARRRLQQPVISVGNLSVGGTGKTPLVAAIAERLLERGERPAILSRGYRRRVRVDGAVVVSDGTNLLSTVDLAGDEPLMLAARVRGAAVIVGEDRHLAGALAERQFGATVHVMDDGFQHVQLARDLDILVTRAGEIGTGRTLPFGRLRESPRAAARADLLVVVDADGPTAKAEAWALGISQAVAARRTIASSPAPDQPVIAIAGIGDPSQFFAMLTAAGYAVRDTLAFADHHRYTARDVSRIVACARGAGTDAVLTTEKDAVRLTALGAVPFRVVPVPMTLAIEDWPSLDAAISAALDRARQPHSPL
ncbi:MAG TPA: tetraacyldisaccharide 4'-kinase [Vicinamibacterales bacterium]|nr:tetraacyldisaccharide 4'-kinase [Vicinamibacterales bacterium]